MFRNSQKPEHNSKDRSRQPVLKKKTKWGNMIDTLRGGANFLGKEMEEQGFEDECSDHFYLFYRKHVPRTLCLELSVNQRSRVAISCVAGN